MEQNFERRMNGVGQERSVVREVPLTSQMSQMEMATEKPKKLRGKILPCVIGMLIGAILATAGWYVYVRWMAGEETTTVVAEEGLPEAGGGIPSSELTDGELPEGELPDDLMGEGLPDGELPDGELPEGELPEDGLPEEVEI